MKAAVIHEYGGPEVLRYEDYPDPVLQPGEVLVRVAAAGVNPVDALERSGETKAWRPVQFPGVLGWDLSGTVEKLGSWRQRGFPWETRFSPGPTIRTPNSAP